MNHSHNIICFSHTNGIVWREEPNMFIELTNICNAANKVILEELAQVLDKVKLTECGQQVCGLESIGQIQFPLPDCLLKFGNLLHDKFKKELETTTFLPALALMCRQSYDTFKTKLKLVLEDVEFAPDSTSPDEIDYSSKLPSRLVLVAPVKGMFFVHVESSSFIHR